MIPDTFTLADLALFLDEQRLRLARLSSEGGELFSAVLVDRETGVHYSGFGETPSAALNVALELRTRQ